MNGLPMHPADIPDHAHGRHGTARTGVGRSLDVYYRDRARMARMTALNARFVPMGGLAFDIGAHVGDRTASFLQLGASVVALEPQPRVFRALRLIHGRNPNVTLRAEAVGAAPGNIDLFVNTANPTVSTVSRDLVTAARTAPGWRGQVWDGHARVPMTTLDLLVSEYGTPDFVKIDVEGHEFDVLSGLSTPLPALSFEFTTLQRPIASACIERLTGLARYEFNWSLGEEHRLRHENWINAKDITEEIAAQPEAANSGDVFARRVS